MKKITPVILFALIVTSCNGWTVQPLPYNPPTPFVLPTRTPAIFSPTPVIIGATNEPATPVPPVATITPTFFPTNTDVAPATPTNIPLYTDTPTSQVNAPALQIDILGCNTSLDITHGMGEVTNAYVTLKNIGNVDLTNLIATLYALDEGRVHPDKTREIASLPVRYEVTIKLTVDSTFKTDTPIQVEVSSDQQSFPREGLASCRDLGLFVPKPEGLNTPVPTN
jgi:hypothetical protein